MATAGDSSKGVGVESPNPNVTELLRWLNLTEEEAAIADFTEDEEDEEIPQVEWAIVASWVRCFPRRRFT